MSAFLTTLSSWNVASWVRMDGLTPKAIPTSCSGRVHPIFWLCFATTPICPRSYRRTLT